MVWPVLVSMQDDSGELMHLNLRFSGPPGWVSACIKTSGYLGVAAIRGFQITPFDNAGAVASAYD